MASNQSAIHAALRSMIDISGSARSADVMKLCCAIREIRDTHPELEARRIVSNAVGDVVVEKFSADPNGNQAVGEWTWLTGAVFVLMNAELR